MFETDEEGAFQIKTTKATTAPPISIWFNGNEGVFETHKSSTTTAGPQYFDDGYVGREQHYATGRYRSTGPDVYGAVVQEPGKTFGSVRNHESPDEFGLLKRILYKEPADEHAR